jgi:hypothetical protein
MSMPCWREYDPEDTVRFYARRRHEAGRIRSSPQQIIAQGTDWYVRNERKTALKGARGTARSGRLPCARMYSRL